MIALTTLPLLPPGALGIVDAAPFLAEMDRGHLLAIALMIAGAIVLRHAFRPRASSDEIVIPVRPRETASLPSPETNRSGEELRTLIGEAQQVRRVLADETDRHAERLEALIARAEAAITRLETLSRSDAAAAKSLRREDGVDPLNRRIYEMADLGLPPVEIARSLNQQTGKVELVLALRPR